MSCDVVKIILQNTIMWVFLSFLSLALGEQGSVFTEEQHKYRNTTTKINMQKIFPLPFSNPNMEKSL